jgi:hypothetical protein
MNSNLVMWVAVVIKCAPGSNVIEKYGHLGKVKSIFLSDDIISVLEKR